MRENVYQVASSGWNIPTLEKVRAGYCNFIIAAATVGHKGKFGDKARWTSLPLVNIPMVQLSFEHCGCRGVAQHKVPGVSGNKLKIMFR